MVRKRLGTEEIARLLAISRSHPTRHGKDEKKWLKAHGVYVPYAVQKAYEPERIEAIESLSCEYRLQLTECKEGERAEIDPLLLQGIKGWGLYLFAQPDPQLAIAIFLGKKQKPGKKSINTARDRDIASAVLDKMNGGMTMENAVAAVAAAYELSEDRVKEIYLDSREEAKAAQIEAKAAQHKL
jgi:hypothetical protein